MKIPPKESYYNRNQLLLELLKSYGVKTFIELGVYYGDTANFLLSNYDFEKYYAIDNWFNGNFGLEGYQQEEIDYVKKYCFEQLSQFKNVEIIDKDSVLASTLMKDHSIDAIFIDASHDTFSVLRDITVWYRKIKKIIIGDNYELGGVQKAVDFLFPQRAISEAFNDMGKTTGLKFWYYPLI